ncbi:MAG TPA: hypothetical protein PK402_11430, partial [Tepidisphaeraceae bacterium]|nr:hypothetical protein [Tepidisphaeraceae bacterium]
NRIWLVISLATVSLIARDLKMLWMNRHARRIILATLMLGAWGMLLISTVRSFNGGLWLADWAEHRERATAWLSSDRFGTVPNDMVTVFTARPPFQNIVTAVAQATVGSNFESYLYITTLLSMLIAPAAMLLLPSVARRGRSAIWILTALLILSPMIAQNATFGWTKLYSGFFALTGLWFFLRSWRRTDRTRLILSALCFAAGALVHYSIVTYIVVLALPYLINLFRSSRQRWIDTIIASACACVLGLTWFGFSIYQFGFDLTFSGNTSVIDSSTMTFEQNVNKVLKNIEMTIIPSWPAVEQLERAGAGIGFWRDRAFLAYQTNLPFMAGLIGLPLILLSRFWKDARPSAGFWIYYIVATIVIGIATHGSLTPVGGLGHITHTPLMTHALCAVAIGIQRLREKGWRFLLALALGIDAVFGIVIHFWLQTRFVEPKPYAPENIPDPDMTATAYENAYLKALNQLLAPFDHWHSMRVPLIALIILICAASIWYVSVVSARRVRS